MRILYNNVGKIVKLSPRRIIPHEAAMRSWIAVHGLALPGCGQERVSTHLIRADGKVWQTTSTWIGRARQLTQRHGVASSLHLPCGSPADRSRETDPRSSTVRIVG
jgi:hypothetical protein